MAVSLARSLASSARRFAPARTSAYFPFRRYAQEPNVVQNEERVVEATNGDTARAALQRCAQ